MVVPLGPGKFYGRSLPRPRFYTDVKFNEERVDPPAPVLDPFLSWANDAHWSMGGLNFKRLRLQGRIEGSISKLRVEREKISKKKQEAQIRDSPSYSSDRDGSGSKIRNVGKSTSVSPPPAPMAAKKRRFMAMLDDAEEEEQKEAESEVRVLKRRRLVKKLGDDFDRVASETRRVSPLKKGLKDRRVEEDGIGKDVMKVVEAVNEENSNRRKLSRGGREGNNGGETESNSASGTRSSPRLAKLRSS